MARNGKNEKSDGRSDTKARPLLDHVPLERCRLLRRNPQYLTPAQMEALKESIARDGFSAPILLRPLEGGDYEIVSGNHRFLAAQELGHATVPAVIRDMTPAEAQRLAINLNTVHGDPNAELMAPFLAEMDDEVLRQIHLPDALAEEIVRFDETLQRRLAESRSSSAAAMWRWAT